LPIETAQNLVEDFNSVTVKEKLDLLLEFSEALPTLPDRYRDHPDLLERVEECQTPIFLFVELEDQKRVRLFFKAPEEAPTTRGFASILFSVIDGLPAEQVLDFDDDFPAKLGLAEAVSPLRMRGMRGMLQRIKRQVAEKTL
jgi:cysteine desulfuration protein SufE